MNKNFFESRQILKRLLFDRESFEVSEQVLMEAGWSANFGISITLSDTGKTGYLFGEYIAEDLFNGFFKIFKDEAGIYNKS